MCVQHFGGNKFKINMISKYEIVVWYIDIVSYTERERELLSIIVVWTYSVWLLNTVLLRIIAKLTCYNWLISSYNCIDATTLSKL